MDSDENNYQNNPDNYDEVLEQSEFIPQNQIDLQDKLLKPDAKELFDYINKDFVITNITDKDIKRLMVTIDLINDLTVLEDKDERFKGVKNMFLGNVYAELNLKRSRNGFERRLMTTITRIQKMVDGGKKGLFK